MTEPFVLNLPDHIGFTPDFFKFMTSSHKESDGKHQSQARHKESQPELVLHFMIGIVNDSSQEQGYYNTNQGRNRNSFRTRSQKEGNEKDTASSHFAPNVPGNIEAKFVGGDIVRSGATVGGNFLFTTLCSFVLVLAREDGDLPVHTGDL